MEQQNKYRVIISERAALSLIHISSDVGAAYDPMYADVYDKKSSSFFGNGLVIKKHTGSRGKSGSTDANAEYLSLIHI